MLTVYPMAARLATVASALMSVMNKDVHIATVAVKVVIPVLPVSLVNLAIPDIPVLIAMKMVILITIMDLAAIEILRLQLGHQPGVPSM